MFNEYLKHQQIMVIKIYYKWLIRNKQFIYNKHENNKETLNIFANIRKYFINLLFPLDTFEYIQNNYY